MSVGAGDEARLRRIESELVQDDPSFVARFRSFPPADGPGVLPGWSVVPPRVAMAFLVGLATWMLTPVIGAILVVTLAVCVLCRRWEARACAVRDPGRGSPRRRP